jgi:hypothetical protein
MTRPDYRYVPAGALFLAAAVSAGCGSRPESWDQPPSVQFALGLSGSVVVLDEAVHAADLMSIRPGFQMAQSRQPVGESVANVRSSPSGDRVFVLTRGRQPRRMPSDERPKLWVYDGKGSGQLLQTYELSEALNGLEVDPQGRFVVIYAAGDTGSFLDNPNELVIVDTQQPQREATETTLANPVTRTIRSYGGNPQRLTFTPSIQVPTGQRRLLVVECDEYLSILDLDNLDRPEITVKLSESGHVTPAGLTLTEGAPDNPDDSRIAVRAGNANSVFLLTLAPQTKQDAPNDFKIEVNIVGFSTVPSDFAFVNTDGGLRLAVLQPSVHKATLVDPQTSVTTDVDMPASYGRMAVVTRQVGEAPSGGSDVALLWGGASSTASGVAFWSLGKSVGQAYRSIETLPDVAASVTDIVDVPAPHDELKILVPTQLQGGAGRFHVLNLAQRTAAPLQTTATQLQLTVSSDGERAWFYQEGGYNVAQVDLLNLHPTPLVLDRPIWKVFEVATLDSPTPGRALVALHRGGTLGATVLNALVPDEAAATRYAAILQGAY